MLPAASKFLATAIGPGTPLGVAGARLRSLLTHERTLTGLALGWGLVVFAAFQPGTMSSDAVGQIAQVLAKELRNWHPPLSSLIYGWSLKLVGSPWPALVLQLLGLSLGFAGLLRPTRGSFRVAGVLLLVLTLCLPPVWSHTVSLWKDTLTGVSLVCAVLCLQRRRPYASFGFQLLAVLFRHNGILAIVPLALAASGQVPLLARSWGRRVAGCLAALLVAAVSPRLLDRAVGARDDWPLGSILVYDLAGIYVSAPPLYPGSTISQYLTLEQLKVSYSPVWISPLFWSAPPQPNIPPGELVHHREALKREWFTAVRARPDLYLRHRRDNFLGLMGLSSPEVLYPFHMLIDPNPWNLTLPTEGKLHQALLRVLERARNGLLFRGWFWLALCVLLALASQLVPGRRSALACWCALSGASYAVGYLLVGVNPDFRFLYWTVLSVPASAFLWLAETGARGQQVPAPADPP